MSKQASNRHRELLQNILRQVRLEAGLTQVDLANIIGQPQSFISKCESGERRLDLIELRAICQAVGLSLEDFVHKFEDALR